MMNRRRASLSLYQDREDEAEQPCAPPVAFAAAGHEAGHTCVALALCGPGTVRRVWVTPNGCCELERKPISKSGRQIIGAGGAAAERVLGIQASWSSGTDLRRCATVAEWSRALLQAEVLLRNHLGFFHRVIADLQTFDDLSGAYLDIVWAQEEAAAQRAQQRVQTQKDLRRSFSGQARHNGEGLRWRTTPPQVLVAR